MREFRRTPDREHDGTATWSLTTLQRALRAPDGLPAVSTKTILTTLWGPGTRGSRVAPGATPAQSSGAQGGAGDRDRPRHRPQKDLIERAYTQGERLGLQVWTQDEAGPYQALPQPGPSWQPEGQPVRHPHEYVRGGTAKLLTLFRPATGEVRALPVARAPNAVLHPWLTRELEAILADLPVPPARPIPPVPLRPGWCGRRGRLA